MDELWLNKNIVPSFCWSDGTVDCELNVPSRKEWIDTFNTMNGTDIRLLLMPVAHLADELLLEYEEGNADDEESHGDQDDDQEAQEVELSTEDESDETT
ncbi:hypothetical protein EMCRGX_G000317 [Ephydatia muelleri]